MEKLHLATHSARQWPVSCVPSSLVKTIFIDSFVLNFTSDYPQKH